ncbi:DNA mismatch repair protein MutL [Kordia antarctica]|uniref:DNA mismatch repair protein MutL n=1 Tax=Kordia antarctica TaxID=1218801 RepID=A0A7L4ZR77_9FLAO|nr:DNA mismatch repair endonuclease MutL [Kordia antarctica]QHI39007.1 DNA mismatch repair protein MutL [Kordia antarctica]
MADIIKLLPDHVANQIAAGEVVQRPASVVKELLENAIDAQATEIKLIVKEAGKTLIHVIDNGFGMSETDARLSFERHATSKIKAAEDLFNLHTKGFRGEALASIAAIAHVELQTKNDDSELGTRIKIEGSTIVAQEVVTTPTGTSISVKNLFYNIPARRNFLKSNTVELRHIIDEFQRVSLAHSDISFVLYHNGNELFNLPISNSRQRIVNILGGKTNEKLVPIQEDTEIVKIKGFVGKPEFAKKSRNEQFFFVNNRFIKSPYLNHAINAAFEGLLKDKMQPSYFIYLEVNPETIDINIHPTKTEIKFDDEHSLYAMLRATVKHSLGQFNIAPILDFDRDSNLDTPYDYKNKSVGVPKIQVDSSFNPFADEKMVSRNTATPRHPAFRKESTEGWESLYVGLESGSSTTRFSGESIEFESEEVTSSFFNNDETRETLTYQLHRKYLVSSIKSGIVVIDQHRAHQRVLYEQLLKNITVSEAVSQQLLFPVTFSFSTSEIALLKEVKESLENIGFMFSKITDDTIELSGIPSNISESELQIIIEQMLNDFQGEIPDTGFSQTDVLVKSLAKSMAIRTGKKLEVEEQQALVNNLFACKEPTVSPFQKTIFITLSVDDLDKKFI